MGKEATTTWSTATASTAPSKVSPIAFLRMVERRMFVKLEEALWKESDDEKLRLWLEDDDSQTVGKSNSDRALTSRMLGETPLHRLAAVRPPASLIAILIQRMTTIYKNSPLDVTDALGRTPLHVAAARGSAEIVHLLTHGCPGQSTLVTATLFNDAWIRSPLHWACTHTKEAKNTTILKRLSMIACPVKVVDMVGAVQVLIDAYPVAVLHRDRDGRTPVSLAVEHDADPRIVELVFQTAMKMSRGHSNAKKDWFGDDFNGKDDASFSLPEGFPEEITVYTTTTATKSRSTR